MKVALKGYSDLRTGKARNLVDQREYMGNFYHGKSPDQVPQIELISKAHINYSALFDEVISTATNKNDAIDSVRKYHLKKNLTRDQNRLYYSSTDIRPSDMEKRHRSGKQLISGRNVYDMATRGVKNFK